MLPSLSHLILEGSYKQLHNLVGLMELECSSAKISDVQELAPKLQLLAIRNSSLLGVCMQGLSSCTALTQLELENPCSIQENGQEYLDRGLSLNPTNIRLLAQLHTLQLHTHDNLVEANVEWISQLTSLQDLSMSFGGRHENVIQHVLLLTRVTH